MGRITSSVGLASGFPIQDTVDKLIAIESQPQQSLQSQVNQLTSQQNALTVLSTALIKLQLTALSLNNPNTFDARAATSSNPSALAVTTSGFPAIGNYQFRPLQLAQSQQLLSSGFASNTSAIGAGTLTLGFGGAVDVGAQLGELNGGNGVAPGSIRITDRSGASAVIDLSTARTVDDVLAAVNNNPSINVHLSVEGDHFVLTDKSGQSVNNLKVQEVGNGTTAADLGLGGINVAADQAQGMGVVKLGNSVLLSSLNDGNGVRFDPIGPDLQVGFHDGSAPLVINFTKPAVAGTKATTTTTSAAGLNGQLVITAKTAGSAYAGVQVRFQNDPSVSKGSEVATYSSTNKVLTIRIAEGQTTSSDVVQAIARSASASAAFTASLPPGSSGSGLVSSVDSGITAGPPASATTSGVLGTNSRIQFTALKQGDNYDKVHIAFVDDSNVTAGSETVVYDDTNPNDKTLTIHISAGQTTANDVIAALNRDPVAGQLFQASTAAGSNGTGLVSTSDSAITDGGEIVEPQAAQSPTTVGDLLEAINAADPARLKAQISTDGRSIELIDLTSGANAFTVTDLNRSHVAADLGLSGNTSDDTVEGKQVLSGLKSVLLSSLNGGQGLGTLGSLQITDRSGASATIDLSNAATLDDVISAINGAGLGVHAQVNDAHNGISIEDTTGQTTSNLVIADADASQTAEKLGLAVNAATDGINSGGLKLQTVNENTLLSSLNGGAGVALGSFRIFNSAGGSAVVDLSQGNVKTIGDVITAINAQGPGVQARINDQGDGIELVDTLGGSGKLSVQDISATTAKDLHLTGAANQQTVGGQPQQVIDGSNTFVINVSASDTLDSVVQKINALNGGFSAAELNSGAGANPYKLSIASQRSGSAGNLVFDTSGLNFSLQETVHGTDALVQFGGAGGGTILSSNTNNFTNVVPGLNLQVLGTSDAPVAVSVTATSSTASSAVQAMVDAYNQVQSQIATSTSFTPASTPDGTAQTGPLFGDTSVLQVETQLGSLVSGRFFGAGTIQALASVGIDVQQDGTLSFDSTKFDAAFASNPQSVKDFFTTATNGFSDRLKSTVDRLAAGKNAILVNHLQALNTTITNDNDKIKQWTARLDAERNTLLLSFYRMDNAIAQMQSQMALLNQIQGIGIFANGFSGSGSLGSTTGSSSSSGASSGASGSGSTSGNTTSTTG